jgi:hypothetical protein
MGIVDDLQGLSRPPSKPRYRSTGGFTNQVGTFTSIDETCSSGTVVNSSYEPTAGCSGSFTETWDMVTPNFSKRQRAGELITNPFRSLKETQSCSGQYGRATATANSCGAPVKHWTIDLGGPQAWGRCRAGSTQPNWNIPRMPMVTLLSASDIDAAIAVASTKAWEKSNEHSASILVDAAEFTKTIQLLRDPIQSTSALIRKINSGRRGVKGIKVSDVVDYTSSMWLQYRYGIRPLVSSVQGVVKALDSLHSRKRHTIRSSYPDLRTASTVSVNDSVGSPINFIGQEQYTDELLIRTGLVIEEDLSLSQSLGVDASGMLALPWELVPFSFVADWFSNVNDYLGALVPYLTKSPLSSWVTTHRRTTRTFNVLSSGAVAGWTLTRSVQESRSAIFEEKTRTVGLKTPSVEFKPQAISRVANDLRVVDAFSLLQKQFMRVFTS